MKFTGFGRGLLIGLAILGINLIYVYFKHAPATTTEWTLRVSDGVFQIALLLLVLGVAVFSRLSSYRRRMHLRNITAMYKAKTPEEYQEVVGDEEEKNERDEEALQERGRDVTLLVAALFLIVLAIVLTLDQVK